MGGRGSGRKKAYDRTPLRDGGAVGFRLTKAQDEAAEGYLARENPKLAVPLSKAQLARLAYLKVLETMPPITDLLAVRSAEVPAASLTTCHACKGAGKVIDGTPGSSKRACQVCGGLGGVTKVPAGDHEAGAHERAAQRLTRPVKRRLLTKAQAGIVVSMLREALQTYAREGAVPGLDLPLEIAEDLAERVERWPAPPPQDWQCFSALELDFLRAIDGWPAERPSGGMRREAYMGALKAMGAASPCSRDVALDALKSLLRSTPVLDRELPARFP